MQQYIEKCGSTVRIPNYEKQKMLRCKRAIGQIRQEQGRGPTTAETAAFIGVSVKEVQEMQGYMQGIASLDPPITEDNSLKCLSVVDHFATGGGDNLYKSVLEKAESGYCRMQKNVVY